MKRTHCLQKIIDAETYHTTTQHLKVNLWKKVKLESSYNQLRLGTLIVQNENGEFLYIASNITLCKVVNVKRHKSVIELGRSPLSILQPGIQVVTMVIIL